MGGTSAGGAVDKWLNFDLLVSMGLPKSNVIFCDTKGVIYQGRKEDDHDRHRDQPQDQSGPVHETQDTDPSCPYRDSQLSSAFRLRLAAAASALRW